MRCSGCTGWRGGTEVARKLLAFPYQLKLHGTQRFHHHRSSIDRFKQVPGSGNAFRHAVARRVALSGNLKKTILLADFEPLNAAVTLGIKRVGQAQNSRQLQDALPLALT